MSYLCPLGRSKSYLCPLASGWLFYMMFLSSRPLMAVLYHALVFYARDGRSIAPRLLMTVLFYTCVR